MLPHAPFSINVREADRYLNKSLQFMGEIGLPPSTGRPVEETLAFIASIQGNVITAHGRTFVALLFFRFEKRDEAHHAENQRFLAMTATVVTNALQQYSDARHKISNRGKKPFVSLLLTAAGVRAAGRSLPTEPAGGDSFSSGMLTRHELLGDPTKKGQPSTWDKLYVNEDNLHGAWLVGHRTKAGLRAECRRITQLGAGTLAVVDEETGVVMRDRAGFAREPFGFRDGLSMPSFFRAKRQTGGLVNLPLAQVLIDSDRLDRGGSFMVYRKLEQDVAAFRKIEREMAPHLRAVGLSARDAGRFLVGRNRRGEPLVENPPRPGPGPRIDNRFTFFEDADAQRCPFHAHIRKANFRQQDGNGGVPLKRQREAQFVRRGVVYGRGPKWNPRAVKQPPGGLLFMAYMSNISGQFETMQATWFGRTDAPTAKTGKLDPLLMGGDSTGESQWSWPGKEIPPVNLPRLVTPRGGAYFFVPPLPWLKPPLNSMPDM